MAIEIRFSTNQREVVVTLGAGVKAVIVKGELSLNTFRKDNNLVEVNKTIPAEITVKEVATGKQVTQLEAGEGAPVCYWVGGNLVCW